MSKTLLLIEDDLEFAEAIIFFLESHNFKVLYAETSTDGLSLMKVNKVDLVILDLNLPDFSGFEVCKEIRKQNDTRIIVVSANIGVDSRIKALNLGSDDYMVKPIHPDELLARINARLNLINKNNNTTNTSILTYDKEKNIFLLQGQKISFTPVELKIFSYLHENKNRNIKKEELNQLIDAPYDSRSVEKHIRKIKLKVNIIEGKELIKSEYGLGYSLVI